MEQCMSWPTSFVVISNLKLADIAKYGAPFKIYFITLQHLALLLAMFLCCCLFGAPNYFMALKWYPKGLNWNVCESHCHRGPLNFKLVCADWHTMPHRYYASSISRRFIPATIDPLFDYRAAVEPLMHSWPSTWVATLMAAWVSRRKWSLNPSSSPN